MAILAVIYHVHYTNRHFLPQGTTVKHCFRMTFRMASKTLVQLSLLSYDCLSIFSQWLVHHPICFPDCLCAASRASIYYYFFFYTFIFSHQQSYFCSARIFPFFFFLVHTSMWFQDNQPVLPALYLRGHFSVLEPLFSNYTLITPILGFSFFFISIFSTVRNMWELHVVLCCSV